MPRKIYLLFIIFTALCFVSGKVKTKPTTKGGKGMQLTSSAFSEGQMIPAKYTCDSSNVSPALNWGEAPAGAQSLALICDDPDAPGKTWVHWVIFNIPSNAKNLDENVPKEKELKNGARQGVNDFGKVGYGGPCPPGGPHRYYFKLYALDAMLNLQPGAAKAQVEQAMQGHVLAETQLMGLYKR